MREAAYVACIGRRTVITRPEVKRPIGRCRRRWENDIKKDLQNTAWLDSSGSGQGPEAGSREHSNVPSGFVKGGNFLPAEQRSDSYEGLWPMELASEEKKFCKFKKYQSK
jgi:hypothetical protein